MRKYIPIAVLLLTGCPPNGVGESGTETTSSTGPAMPCEPNLIVCEEGGYKTCNAEGTDYSAPTPCGNTDACMEGVGCAPSCEVAAAQGLSMGCSFRAHKPLIFNQDDVSSISVINSSATATATVTLHYGDSIAEGPISLTPYTGHYFDLLDTTAPPAGSELRADATYRVESDVPIAAFLHAPVDDTATGESAMLIPDHAKGDRFIVASHTPFDEAYPAYFNVSAIEDGTEVSWTPPVSTLPGPGVATVAAGATGSVMLDRGGLLQVSSGLGDLSGTIVSTTKPVSVLGAAVCIQIPVDGEFCDYIVEDLFPVSAWGTLYAAPHAPTRFDETYYWRVYSGADGVTVDVDPPQAGFPRTMDEGEYFEFGTLDHLTLSADGPFMPVEYTQMLTVGLGDPASYQMIPVDRYLRRYVFMTAKGFQARFAQVVRKAGAAEVFVDGLKVQDYVDFGDYQVALTEVTEGAHRAESDDPFGLWYIAYHGKVGMAFPAGAALGELAP